MPFIPFSSSYKLSTSASSIENEYPNSDTNSNSNSINISNGNSSAPNLSNPSASKSDTTSANNSPSFQQGNFQLRRKTSMGNALFSLVNSIRQPNVGQSSSKPGLRRGSQSSCSRSRSASVSLSKQVSCADSDRAPESNSSEDLVKSGEEEPKFLPFQVNETSSSTNNFDCHESINNNNNTSSNLNRQLTTIVSVDNDGNNNDNIDQFTRLGFRAPNTQDDTVNNNDFANRNRSHNMNFNSNGNDSLSTSPYIQMNLNEATNPNYDDANSNSNLRSNSNVNTSISITNENNSAHNTFNPAAYNFNMANSPTIPNFSVYADGGVINQNNSRAQDVNMDRNSARTRGNTLRNENVLYEPVPMNSDNNQTIGTEINNPITIDDTDDNNNNNNDDDVILIDESGEEDNEDAVMNEDGNNNNNNNNIESNMGTGSNTIYQDNRDQINECDDNGYFSVRLTPSIDHSSTHPYMFFGPIIRKLKPGKSISLGRYTEKTKKAAIAPPGSSEPVIFKSKVVSRKHAEFTVDEMGRWYIQDIKSSSGTFLNHVRLSLPNTESPKVFVKDNDVLQLGVDYRGGSEEIYRCVKVKIELNYSWKKRAAKFSKEAHEKLKQLTNMGENEELTPCVICLDDIKPCQPVFVSSCSHSWHYRCIRPLLVKTYPQFLCPNCKAICDLEAELEEDEDGGSNTNNNMISEDSIE